MTDPAGDSLVRRLRQDVAAAFMLLTRFPITWENHSPEAPDLNRSLWAYPVVGLVIGLVGALVLAVADRAGLPSVLAVLSAVTVMILATGAFHEDGLADVADGFGGGLGREKKLEIMRDSRIGTYGGLALIISMGLRVGSLGSLTLFHGVTAIIGAAMISRLMIIIGLFILPPARTDSLAAGAGKPKVNSLGAASLITGIFMVLTLGLPMTLLVSVTAVLAMGIMAVIATRQIGGYTGDVLGAIQQVTEIAVLMALSAYWSGL
ncbi:Cobalamin synthase [hydrothermal vent metagenome]|uniref:Adenosylcobinamide-GDP ribazoletransferase n=1 Tax=hydrothermal vent metagenome TaxID=652676 RepID=A0A3B0S4X9_9ZZZZ